VTAAIVSTGVAKTWQEAIRKVEVANEVKNN
jgi:hypothetical protein